MESCTVVVTFGAVVRAGHGQPRKVHDHSWWPWLAGVGLGGWWAQSPGGGEPGGE